MKIENMEEFEASVIEAYNQAVENGYSFDDYTARDVALDMIAYDPSLEPYLDDEGDDEALIAILFPIIQKVHVEPAS